jgi:hypothetical protein
MARALGSAVDRSRTSAEDGSRRRLPQAGVDRNPTISRAAASCLEIPSIGELPELVVAERDRLLACEELLAVAELFAVAPAAELLTRAATDGLVLTNSCTSSSMNQNSRPSRNLTQKG